VFRSLAGRGGVVLSTLVLSACGGGGGGTSSSLPPAPNTPGTSSQLVAAGGSFAQNTSSGFVLSDGSGNPVNVTTTASTSYADAPPTKQSYVEVSGPGALPNVSAQLVASFAASPPSLTVSGTIQQQTAYGFILAIDGGGSVPVSVVSSTTVTGSVAVGQPVTVTGVGGSSVAVFAKQVSGHQATPSPSPSPRPVPSSIPTPMPSFTPVPTPLPSGAPTTPPTPSPPLLISTTHVQTGTYLWSPTETTTNPAVYAPYLTWAYPMFNNMAATHQAGIKTVVYTNPEMPQAGSFEIGQLTGSYPSVQAKDCSGNLITSYGGTGRIADPRSPLAAAYYASVVNWYIQNRLDPYSSSQDWDAMYIDNNGALYGASGVPCNYDPIAWGQAFDSDIAAINQQFITNSLAESDNEVRTYVSRLAAPNIIGGEFEECFNDGMWSAEEDSQLATVALLKSEGKAPGPGWWCYLDNTSAAGSTVIPQRLFAYASFLLTYDVNYSLFQESYTTAPSTFQVFPETGFVPLNPASTPNTVAALQAPSGAYVQSFSACYYRGSLVGSCEVAVNPTNGTVSVPNPQGLAHSMTLSGGGVLDGGSVSFSGAAAGSLAPGTAEILVP